MFSVQKQKGFREKMSDFISYGHFYFLKDVTRWLHFVRPMLSQCQLYLCGLNTTLKVQDVAEARTESGPKSRRSQAKNGSGLACRPGGDR